MTFTLQDFYIESVTAHRIKRNDHHVFTTAGQIQIETKIKTSLRARGPPGVSGGLSSLRILRIGRIGSGYHSDICSIVHFCDKFHFS